jgi:hypothetical protein
MPVLATLSLWLVVENVMLLTNALDHVPAVATIARALLKVAARLAAPLVPALAVFGGAWLLWTSDRPRPEPSRMLEEVRHG